MIKTETSDLYDGVRLYKPMLVHKCPSDVEQLLSNDIWIASKKIDGYWETLVKENNKVYMFARSKSVATNFYTMKIDNVPHLKEWAMEELPNGTVLIGEVYMPNGTSKDVTKILGCLPEKAVERQKGEYGKLHYYVHDMLKFDGHDYVLNEESYGRRYSDLCGYIDIGTNLIPEVEVAGICDSPYVDLLKWGEELISEGEEGIVVRKESGLYLPGKRSKEMFKIKQEQTIDAVIIDCLPPEKVYTGKELNTWPYWEDEVPVTKPYFMHWNNAFRLGAYDGDHMMPIGTVASGLTDELRENMGMIPEKYIGQVVEVQVMSVDKTSMSLRHPRFVRFRPDKPSGDCRIEDIFN